MGITRVLVALLFASAGFPAPSTVVLTAFESNNEAFGEALAGLRTVLGANGAQIIDLHTAGAESELDRALSRSDVGVLVAVGSESLTAVRARNFNVPVIATMVLHPPQGHFRAQVDLEVPLSALLAEMHLLLPQSRRVGIIRGKSSSYPSPEALQAVALRAGYTAVVVESDGPARLLPSVAALRGRADFLLCFPDADLFNSVTIKPLILATLEDRLPVIGFSPGFVRAGAAAGIYPDYQEVGRQAGEMALRIARGEEHGTEEGPRKLRTAVNQRVARLLGIEFHTGPGVEIFR